MCKKNNTEFFVWIEDFIPFGWIDLVISKNVFSLMNHPGKFLFYLVKGANILNVVNLNHVYIVELKY